MVPSTECFVSLCSFLARHGVHRYLRVVKIPLHWVSGAVGRRAWGGGGNMRVVLNNWSRADPAAPTVSTALHEAHCGTI